MISQADLTQKLKKAVLDLGFQKVGIAPVLPDVLTKQRLQDWWDRGFAGTMEWIGKRIQERGDMTAYFPEARSVLVVAMNYYTGRSTDRVGAARDGIKISNYAWGQDYHEIIRSRLKELQTQYEQWTEGGHSRVCVDTSPVMEKAWARKAGLGWIGKHTNLITRDFGSWVFLGEMIVDRELDYDPPFELDHCGTCAACIEACPTKALTEYVLDARKCLSYLTIEYRGDYSKDDHLPRDGWVYGCDICQNVCPWNQSAETMSDDVCFQPISEIETWTVEQWESMEKEDFERLFRKSPIKRTKFTGLKRNLKFVLNESGDIDP